MWRHTSVTFDPVGLVFMVMVILLMAGTIGFTPLSVGALLLLSKIEANFTWR